MTPCYTTSWDLTPGGGVTAEFAACLAGPNPSPRGPLPQTSSGRPVRAVRKLAATPHQGKCRHSLDVIGWLPVGTTTVAEVWTSAVVTAQVQP